MDSIIFTRIKELCQKRGITVNKLELEVGMSQYSISRWKSSNSPTVDKLLRVAQYFGVSLDYLVGQVDISSPKPSIQAACVLTGLSEDSVANLAQLTQSEDYKNRVKLLAINLILEDDGIEEWGSNLLQYLTDYLFAENVSKQPIQFTPQIYEYADILYNRLLTDRVMRSLEEARHKLQQSPTMAEMCGPIRGDILEKVHEEESDNGITETENN